MDGKAEPIYVATDMWEKIILNLLSNALKFTRSGEIRVSVRRIDKGAELVVSDTGIGIPTEYLPRLFERFFRVKCPEEKDGIGDVQPFRSQEGSGIGLPLIKELVAMHGGTISVESTVGKGSDFRVFIPSGCTHLPPDHVRKLEGATTNLDSREISEATRGWIACTECAYDAQKICGHAPEDTSTGKDKSKHLVEDFGCVADTHHRPRILVVDDNADALRYISSLLQPFAKVFTAADGSVALSTATPSSKDAVRRGLDLVLSDVMMPVMDGFALLRALRDNPLTASIPVILLSARAGQEAAVEGLQRGADDYLVKPFVAAELIAKVKSAIRLSRLRKQLIDAERRDIERRHLVATLLERIRAGTINVRQIISEAVRDLSSVVSATRIVLCEVLKESGSCRDSRGTGERCASSSSQPQEDTTYRFTVTYEHVNSDHQSPSASSPAAGIPMEEVEQILSRSWTLSGIGPNALSVKCAVTKEARSKLLSHCSSQLSRSVYEANIFTIEVQDCLWGVLHCLCPEYVSFFIYFTFPIFPKPYSCPLCTQALTGA